MHNQTYDKLFSKTKIKEYWWDAPGLPMLRKRVSDVLDLC
jgi:transposase